MYNLPEQSEKREKLFFVLNGKNRMKIYCSLHSGVKSAREIEIDINISLSSILRNLKEMIEKNVVVCVNSHDRRKFYRLTEDVIDLKEYICSRVKIEV